METGRESLNTCHFHKNTPGYQEWQSRECSSSHPTWKFGVWQEQRNLPFTECSPHFRKSPFHTGKALSMQFCSLRSLPAIPAHVRTCSHPTQTSGKSLRGRRSRPQVFLHLPSRFCPQADKLQSQLHFSELVMKRKNHFSIRKSRTAAQILEQSVSCPDECLGEIKLSS